MRIVKALEQLHSGALATATSAYKSDALARQHRQVEALQHADVWPGWVVERHALETGRAAEVLLLSHNNGPVIVLVLQHYYATSRQ